MKGREGEGDGGGREEAEGGGLNLAQLVNASSQSCCAHCVQ
jgi:hypothetical protein